MQWYRNLFLTYTNWSLIKSSADLSDASYRFRNRCILICMSWSSSLFQGKETWPWLNLLGGFVKKVKTLWDFSSCLLSSSPPECRPWANSKAACLSPFSLQGTAKYCLLVSATLFFYPYSSRGIWLSWHGLFNNGGLDINTVKPQTHYKIPPNISDSEQSERHTLIHWHLLISVSSVQLQNRWTQRCAPPVLTTAELMFLWCFTAE